MIKIKLLLKNAFSNGTAFLVEAICAFLLMPFIVHRIGDSAYGIWLLINAISGYMNFFKLGLRPAVNKHVSQYNALNQCNKIREFIEAGFYIYLFCSIAIIIATTVLYFTVEDIFPIAAQYLSIVKFIIILVGIQTAIGLMGTLFGGVISGYQRYDINAGIEIFVIIFRALLIFIFLPYFPDLYTIAAAHFSLTIIGYIATIFFARKIAPLKQLNLFRKPSKEAMTSILKFSSTSVAVSGLGILIFYADNIVVGITLTTAAITHYSVGGRLIKYTNNLLQVLSHVIAPATSELKALKNNKAIIMLMEYAIRISCLIAFPILLCLIIQGYDFILLWMGEGYKASYHVLLILGIAAFFILPQQIITPVLYGLAKHHLLLYVSIFEIIATFLLGYLGGKYFGVVGIAIGFSCPRALLRGIIFPVFVYRIVGLSVSRIISNCYFRTALSALPFAASLYIFSHSKFIISWPSFVIQLLISLIIYCSSSWFVAFSAEERKELLVKFSNIYNSVQTIR